MSAAFARDFRRAVPLMLVASCGYFEPSHAARWLNALGGRSKQPEAVAAGAGGAAVEAGVAAFAATTDPVEAHT